MVALRWGLSVKLLGLKGNIPALEECAAAAAAPRACAGPACQMCVSSLSGVTLLRLQSF